MVATVVIGAALYVPYDEKKQRLRLSNRDSRMDDSNESQPEDSSGLGVELALRVDDVCTVLSPHPVFRDPVAGGAAKMRSSQKRGEENDGGQRRGNEEQAILLGFDLLAFHTLLGEVANGADVTELAEGDDYAREEGRAPAFDDSSETSSDPLKVSSKKDKGTVPRGKSLSVSKSKVPKHADDAESLVDSIVEGDSIASTLRLDPSYYGGPEKEPSEISFAPSQVSDVRLTIPRDRTSLLARSMQTRLASRGKEFLAKEDRGAYVDDVPLIPASRERPSFMPSAGDRGDGRYVAAHSTAYVPPRSVVPVTGTSLHTRELSRAARSKLSRHGFTAAIQDALATDETGVAKGVHSRQQVLSNYHQGHFVDLELEARDKLSLHDISFQFAGYRSGPHVVPGYTDSDLTDNTTSPRSLYFTFQFYTCAPVRTEVMRLLPAEKGEVSVFTRDDVSARDEAPLAIRFHIDCSLVSPTEALEFAEYLSKGNLFVEVWDADALLLLGVMGIPLRKLMRQGNKVSKCAIECDVIDADGDSFLLSGVTTSVIAEGKPVSGAIAGAVQLIMCNYGQEGRGPSRSAESKGDDGRRENDAGEDMAGLNWRVSSVEQRAAGGADARHHKRPRTSVRARPLSERYARRHSYGNFYNMNWLYVPAPRS